MNNKDDLAQKISIPIEQLKLDTRSYNLLKRGGIQTVSDVIRLGEENVSQLRNVGPVVVDNVFSAIANHLNVSREELSSEAIKKVALLQPTKKIQPINKSINVLNLTYNTNKNLKKAGIILVSDLIVSRENQYKNIKVYGEKFVRRVDRAINTYLGYGTRFVDESFNQYAVANLESQSTQSLKKILDTLRLNDRAWKIIELRAKQLLTLEQISTEIDALTRERIRQIIEQTHGKVSKNFNLLTGFLDYFEEQAKRVSRKTKGEQFDLHTLIVDLSGNHANTKLLFTDNDLAMLITLIRVLIIHRKPWISETIETHWKELTFVCCLADPPITKHERVKRLIERQEKKRKNLSYKELALMILKQAGRSLHWTEIAESAYRLNRRDVFDTRSIYNVLLRHDELFVRVGQGTYELAEWGNKTVDAYPDIIALIMEKENKTMPVDAIFTKVTAVRPAKKSSIIMYLDLHPRFYKSINGSYGLRSWLPPRENQTLRTPEWLIEDSKSLERVEKARQRGYDVETIIANDKLN